MLNDLEQYYDQQPEPIKGCLLALRQLILALDENLNDAWKYRMPFICHKNKMFCYFWIDKATKEPYIGVCKGKQIDHPLLEQGNRSSMKILRIDPNEDLPIDTIQEVLGEALKLYS
ncbi:hypothetical protein BKI52_41515 [marine bacterium AO1-C]|nr:hypothetical protein BKI52_41515 [marine bacterium AO1-C]